MPERDINRLIGNAVVDKAFETRLLNHLSRPRILQSGNLTPEERMALLSIEAETLQQFAQACIDKGLVGEETTLDPKASRHLSLLYPPFHPSARP